MIDQHLLTATEEDAAIEAAFPEDYLWDLLTDEAKDEVTLRAAALKKRGVSVPKMARRLGMNVNTLHTRIRRSEGQEAYSSTEDAKAESVSKNLRYGMKHASPEEKAAVIAEAIASDPEVRELARHEISVSDRSARVEEEAVEQTIAREVGSEMDLLAAMDAMIRIAQRKALPAAQGVKLTTRQATAFEQKVEKLQAALDLISQAVVSGDWDDELAALISREA